MNKVIILLGPTAVGKTGASILLARALRAEIISADSMQIYRYMDIGTAKPSHSELREVPHHLVDILLPSEPFSAGMFREMAKDIIAGLHAKGSVPLIVGGTGLYIRSLTRGLFDGPSADWMVRERLQKEEKEHGKGHLYELLRSVDPDTAARISPNDERRVIRALEVAVRGGRTISEFHRDSTGPGSYDFIKIGLFRERRELYGLIEKRVDKMMEEGLLQETERLLGMNPGRTALQALGYKEMVMYLHGQTGIGEAVRLIKKHTKMYAKRQYTWFRKEPDINWVDITGIMDGQNIFGKIMDEVEILKKLIYS